MTFSVPALVSVTVELNDRLADCEIAPEPPCEMVAWAVASEVYLRRR